ncbi:uncharacterized protein TNCV_397251 [Trichonephila clavipes]|nr:uncharacterized protein TNCV_397251 [Trichonephila clavipes]
MIRVMAWILRFQPKAKDLRKCAELKNEELLNAQKITFRLMQKECYSNEETRKSLKGLLIFEDEEGILRLKSRLINEEESKDFISPIILPSKHLAVRRFIAQEHLVNKHAGTLTLLTILRERFWIVKGKRIVRSVIKECLTCKRQKIKHLEVPFPPLPKDRTEVAAVFQVSGVDLAGPLLTKSKQKAWIVLFTCAVFRAVHLELITSLSTTDFIQAMRRFIARRGRISVMYSDNGTNFTGLNNALRLVGVEPEPKIKMAPKELSELTVFNRRKANLLGQITRIRNSLENVDSPLNQVEIRAKLASLSEVKAKIDKLRTESYRVLSDEELMDFEASLDTMEVDADNLEVSLNTLLESSNVNTSELSVKNDFANYNVKLPSINLPEFSGQYIDWLRFKSQFVSLIHDNACLSDSQKLYYLQSALKGHAKQLQTVNDSYSSLFEALEGRYENKRLIVNSHIAELLNPNKIKFESAFHLRSLIDSIQSHLRALKQLELEPNALCESMLIFVITQRLDDESRKQYEMELHSNDLPKWNNFLDFLIKRSQALENVQRISSLKNKNEYFPKFRSFVVKSNGKILSVMSFRDTPSF